MFHAPLALAAAGITTLESVAARGPHPGMRRRAAAGARQSDMARTQGISPALLGRWQRQARRQAVPSSAECEEIKQLRAALKRV